MARVTVEDCIDKMQDSNRFSLCMFASTRSKEIVAGADITIEHDALDKAPVIALREIAAGKIHYNTLKEIMVKSMQLTQQLDNAKEYIASTKSYVRLDDKAEDSAAENLIFDGSTTAGGEDKATIKKDEQS